MHLPKNVISIHNLYKYIAPLPGYKNYFRDTIREAMDERLRKLRDDTR